MNEEYSSESIKTIFGISRLKKTFASKLKTRATLNKTMLLYAVENVQKHTV